LDWFGLDWFELKRPRRYERNESKGNRFGGSKAPKTPVSVGEEYNVKIEEMSRQGMGVAKIDGFVILVNNTRPGDRVMIRITKVGSGFAAAEVFGQNIKKDPMQEIGSNETKPDLWKQINYNESEGANIVDVYYLPYL
jgi:predicted RNA-binding protein with TRAM domain